MTTRLQSVALACCLSLTSCAPFKVEIGRPLDGAVVDSRTNEPIQGAEVMYKGHGHTKVTTDAEGEFHLDRQQVTKWLPLIPADYFGWRWHPVLIRASGYESQVYQPPREPESSPARIELVLRPCGLTKPTILGGGG